MSVNAVINIVLYVFTAVLALIGFLMGLARGIRNQTIRSITVALSALVSALLMKVFYNAVLRSVSGKTPWEIVQSLGVTVSDEIAEALQNMDASVVEYVVPLVVCFIILPFLFVFTFVVLSALMLIVYKIIAVALDHKKTSSAEKTAEGEPAKSAPDRRRPNGVSRAAGALLGLIQGVAVTMVLLVPIAGFLNLADRAVTAMKENDPEGESTEKAAVLYEENLAPINGNIVIRATQVAGGNAVFRYFTAVKVPAAENEEQQKDNLQDDAVVLVRIAARSSALSQSANWSSLSEADKRLVEDILNDFSESPYLVSLGASVLRSASGYLEQKISESDSMEEPTKIILGELVGSMKQITPESFKADLGTVKNVYFILSDVGVLAAIKDGGDVAAALAATDENGNTAISRVIAELNANEHISGTVSALTDVSLAVLLGKLDMDEETKQKIADMKDDLIRELNEVLALNEADFESHEAYVAEIRSHVENLLTDYEITLEPEVLDRIAEYIADPGNFVDEDGVRMTSVTEDDLIEFALAYFDSISEERE